MSHAEALARIQVNKGVRVVGWTAVARSAGDWRLAYVGGESPPAKYPDFAELCTAVRGVVGFGCLMTEGPLLEQKPGHAMGVADQQLIYFFRNASPA